MLDGYSAVQVLRSGECHGRSVLFTAPSKVTQDSFTVHTSAWVSVGYFTHFGTCATQDVEQLLEHHVVFDGTTLSTGPDNTDEELFVRGNRWSMCWKQSTDCCTLPPAFLHAAMCQKHPQAHYCLPQSWTHLEALRLL